MPQIEHVIVLMMENRSFDHLLGFLDHPSPNYPRLRAGAHPNKYSAEMRKGRGVDAKARYEIVGPGHDHIDAIQQIFGNEDAPKDWLPAPSEPLPAPKMRGFVRNYYSSKLRPLFSRGAARKHALRVMQCMDESKIPVISTLAKEYAVCTRWFCSVPGQTFPNRDYAFSGTSNGEVDNYVRGNIGKSRPTIFSAVEATGREWKIYHEDVPFAATYPALRTAGRFRSHRDLLGDIEDNTLPHLAWVEPDYGLVGSGNSQHPGQADSAEEFVEGERLIAKIHDALTANTELFSKTLFLLVYDEHGGFFDHEPPPRAVPPDEVRYSTDDGYEFAFDRLGPRVPAIIMSPWIRAGTIFDTQLDHTSISKTLEVLFGAEALGKRAKAANSFWPANSDGQEFITPQVRRDLRAVLPKVPRIPPRTLFERIERLSIRVEKLVRKGLHWMKNKLSRLGSRREPPSTVPLHGNNPLRMQFYDVAQELAESYPSLTTDTSTTVDNELDRAAMKGLIEALRNPDVFGSTAANDSGDSRPMASGDP
ncbi:MAG: alkaline phosphatase family protein [Myxococcota bacterium]